MNLTYRAVQVLTSSKLTKPAKKIFTTEGSLFINWSIFLKFEVIQIGSWRVKELQDKEQTRQQTELNI